MDSTRGVDDILAELLAADEGAEPPAALPEQTKPRDLHLDAPSNPAATELLANPTTATSHAGAVTGTDYKQSAGVADSGLDWLLGDLLTAPPHAAANTTASADGSITDTSAKAAVQDPTHSITAPAAAEQPLVDLLDSLLVPVQPTPAAPASSADANGAVAASTSADSTATASLSGWGARGNSSGAGQPQQQQATQQDPFAELATAVGSVTGSVPASSSLQQATEVPIPVTEPSTLAGTAAVVSDVDGQAVTPATAQQAAKDAAELAASAESDVTSSDSDDDDVLDMLHDMAEVLEVEQSASGAGAAPAAEQQQAPAAQGAQTSAAAEEDAAAGSKAALEHSNHQAALANGSASASAADSLAGQQRQQLQQQDAPARQPSLLLPGTSQAPPAAAQAAGVQPASSTQLPPHELALQRAWQYEETLYHGGLVQHTDPQQQQQGKRQRLEPLPRLKKLLSDARQDWNPAGRPDASGSAMIGGAVLLKLESLAGLFAGAAGMGATGRGSSSGGGAGSAVGGVDWGHVLGAALAPHGPLQVVAASGPYVAVGSTAGSAILFQLPTPQTAATQQGLTTPPTHPNPSHQHQHNTLPGGAAMWQLGEGLSGDAVTCLGFSVVASGGDALWLAVGHESGALTVWELQKRGPRQVAAIAQHGARLTLASFPPSRSTSVLISGDVRGRLCLHTFSNLLLRTNVSSKVLINGQYGALLGISHLTPFSMPAPPFGDLGLSSNPSTNLNPNLSSRQSPSPDSAAQNPNASSTERLSPKRGFSFSARGGGTPPLSPKIGGRGSGAGGDDEAIWKAFFEDGAWRVGEGIFCLLTPTHVYIARLKPNSNDIIMLISIPQPSPGPQAAVPVAAWLPHNRKPSSAGFRVHAGDSSSSSSSVGDGSSTGSSMVVPVAVLALGWGSRLVMFEVPLIGDHIAVGAVLASEGPGSAATALAAAAAGQLRRPGSFSSNRAAQRSQQTLEALTPNAAAQIAGYFPLSISGTWAGGPHSNSSGGGSSAKEPNLGPSEPLPILGAHWLDADAVAVVCQQGFSSLLLVLGFSTVSADADTATVSNSAQAQGRAKPQTQSAVIRVQEQVEWMDQPVDRQWAVSGGLAAWGMDCHSSVVGVGPRVYLLGQQGGVFCGRLMPWSERLKTLQDVKKFKLGLFYALRFQQASQQQQVLEQQQQQPHHQRRSSYPSSTEASAAGSGGGSGPAPAKRISTGGGLARSEGLGAEPQQIEQWMLSLMLGHAAAALQEVAAAAAKQAPQQQCPQQAPMAVRAAAEICVCLCLMLSRVDVLFERVYPLFARSGVTGAGAVGAFVEVLELAVLSDLLESLPPEIMQALVDHFATIGQPERVEGCVLHLSIMSLDLNQVIRLCESAGLYSALTFIYNHIGDYRKPLLDLSAAVAGAGGFAEAHRFCCKVLVYLRCCFRGLKFPPGTGYLTSPTGTLDSIKSSLLGSLLFLNKSDLIAEWTQSGGRAAAAAAALTAASSSSNGDSQESMPFCAGLSDPHPALQLLLSVDVSAVVAVLSEMTSGWDAVETDLRAAAGKPAAELESVLVATQVVVNAIIALLEAGKFDQWKQAPGSNGSSGQLTGSSIAMNYITDLLAAGRVTVRPAFALRLLDHIVTQAAAAAAGASHGSATVVLPTDLEQQFISIINVVGISPVAPQQQQGDSTMLSPSQAQAALKLANKAGFMQAAAAVHHLQGNHEQAIAAYLEYTGQQQQQQQGLPTEQRPQGVFQYLERFLDSNSNSPSCKPFMSAVMQHVEQLIRLDPAATAALLLRHQPDYQVPVLTRLQQQPELQFKFLQAAMQQAMLLQRAQQAAGDGLADLATLSTSAAAAAAAGSSPAAAAAAEKLLERSEVADLYVQLMARFEPNAVMPFLQSHHNYNVAAAINACAAAGVSDAEAFLHERLGDLDAALKLYLAAVAAANQKLAAALLSGDIPVLYISPGLDGSSSSSSNVHKVQWGLGPLLDQLQNATANASSSSSSRSDTEGLAAVAAVVAGSLLQQLSPTDDDDNHLPAAASMLLPSGSNASAVLGQQQQQQGPAVVACVDLHKAWMAELSPRLRLKGLGMSSSSSSSVALQRAQSAAAAAAASAAAVTAPAIPSELLAAWRALQSAIAFCQRNTSSTAASSSSRDRGEAGNGKQLWFSLMEAYVTKLRSLQGNFKHPTAAAAGDGGGSSSTVSKLVGNSQQQQQQQDQQFLSSLSAAAAGQLPVSNVPATLQTAAAAVAAAVAHDLFRLLLDELVCVMADHLPLLDIVSRVLQQYGSERFGEFRSTLLGLFGATAYESAIMTAANRLITGDAFTAVRKAYALRTLAREATEQQQGADEAAAAASSSTQQASDAPSSSAAAAAAAAAELPGISSPTLPSTATSIRTAQALGVLNRLGSSSSSGVHSLTQVDKDMIMGVLGPVGVMHLQLQPAGPAAGHLAGVAAEFRTAARRAQMTKRVYKGEIDLAIEISLMHQQQQQQHNGSHQMQGSGQQHYRGGGGSGVGRKQSPGSLGHQQQQEGGGSGATAVAGATAGSGVVSSPRESFDIDELLDWSQNNMS